MTSFTINHSLPYPEPHDPIRGNRSDYILHDFQSLAVVTDTAISKVGYEAAGAFSMAKSTQEKVGKIDEEIASLEEKINSIEGFNFRGPYISGKTYAKNDIVEYVGSAWVARKSISGVRPGEDSEAWGLLASRGEPGPKGVSGGGEISDPLVADLVASGTETFSALRSNFIPLRGTTEVFVNPTSGSDSNAGTSADSPLRTVNKAVSLAEEAAQKSDTTFIITLAPGIYTERVKIHAFTPFMVNLLIRGADTGGHPNVPTTRFQVSNGTSAVAINVRNQNLQLTVRDVAFQGYNGSMSSGGISGEYAPIYLENCHFQDCFYGASNFKSVLDVKGGAYDDCGYLNGAKSTGGGAGVRSMMHNRHNIGTQNAGTNDNGPFFRNCYYGVLSQEFSTGHVDWATFEDCYFGVGALVTSRANVSGSVFRRNRVDLRAHGNSNFYIQDGTTTFGTGADKSGTRIQASSGSVIYTKDPLSNAYTHSGVGWQALRTTDRGATLTGPSSSTVVESTLGRFWWDDDAYVAGRGIRFEAKGGLLWLQSGRSFTFTFGSESVSLPIPNVRDDFSLEAQVIFMGKGVQVMELVLQVSGQADLRVVKRVQVDMAAGALAKVSCELGDGQQVKVQYTEILLRQ